MRARTLSVMAALASISCGPVPGDSTSQTSEPLELETQVTSTAEARLSDPVVSFGNPVLARVNVHQKFSSIESVCFDFTFANDLLDPGEELQFTSLWRGGWAMFNGGSTAQEQRTLCIIQPEVSLLFLDGKERMELAAYPSGSSIEIAEMIVRVTGVPRH